MIDMVVDFSEMKRVLSPTKYKIALQASLMEGAEVAAQLIKKEAPVYPGPEPAVNGFTAGSERGALRKSIHAMALGGIAVVVSDSLISLQIMRDHKIMSKPGQRKWFWRNYPSGYVNVRHPPGAKIAKAHDFLEGMGTIDATIFSKIVQNNIDLAIKL